MPNIIGPRVSPYPLPAHQERPFLKPRQKLIIVRKSKESNVKVAILGASDKADRYANMAQKKLMAAGHEVFPINPRLSEIEGIKVYPNLSSLSSGSVDTLTVYVGPKNLEPLVEDIIRLRPRRVILNPGTESDSIADALSESGMEVVRACTLVMLTTGQFGS
jgi:uncharacterized protein